jgi:8-oxo-dGTP pyrophosphatase MutT (NUDIX family)
MEKFSKIKPKEYKNFFDKDKEEVEYKDEWVKIIKYEDWSIIKENDTVFCIPYLIEKNQFIIRQEYIPTFKYQDGQEYHLALVGGGIEDGETPEMALLREIQEEAGLVLRDTYKIDFEPPLFKSKSSTGKYHIAIVPLNENDYYEIPIKGDGSKVEKLSQTVKLDLKYINNLNPSDVLTQLMLMKLKDYTNIK